MLYFCFYIAKMLLQDLQSWSILDFDFEAELGVGAFLVAKIGLNANIVTFKRFCV